MRDPDRLARRASELLRGVSPEGAERLRVRAKWRARKLVRLAKIGAWMAGAAVVVPVTMITTGLLLGPRGYEGLVAAPLSVLAAWGAILYVGLKRRPSAKRIERADVSALPEQVEEWIDRHRALLPAAAQGSLDDIARCLEEVAPQVRGLPADAPFARHLRRLLVDELTPLVEGYLKLPKGVRQKPLYGGPSPEQSLIESLATLDQELSRLRDRMASEDLNSLATQQRYLEMKYRERDDD